MSMSIKDNFIRIFKLYRHAFMKLQELTDTLAAFSDSEEYNSISSLMVDHEQLMCRKCKFGDRDDKECSLCKFYEWELSQEVYSDDNMPLKDIPMPPGLVLLQESESSWKGQWYYKLVDRAKEEACFWYKEKDKAVLAAWRFYLQSCIEDDDLRAIAYACEAATWE